MKGVILSLPLTALYAGIARAASGAGDDSSSIFTWIFFGMVGLIIAVLLAPAARSLRDLAGSVEKKSDTAEEKVPRR